MVNYTKVIFEKCTLVEYRLLEAIKYGGFFLLLGNSAMNDSDVVIDTHARKHTYKHRENKNSE
jgi:hypothetical protein